MLDGLLVPFQLQLLQLFPGKLWGAFLAFELFLLLLFGPLDGLVPRSQDLSEHIGLYHLAPLDLVLDLVRQLLRGVHHQGAAIPVAVHLLPVQHVRAQQRHLARPAALEVLELLPTHRGPALPVAVLLTCCLGPLRGEEDVLEELDLRVVEWPVRLEAAGPEPAVHRGEENLLVVAAIVARAPPILPIAAMEVRLVEVRVVLQVQTHLPLVGQLLQGVPGPVNTQHEGRQRGQPGPRYAFAGQGSSPLV
mmetsp:Transcript_2510/g.5898  ORF Transcript_2510/g.5898 Transcript_2510/m.5898 type:complete len:249 (-) Transcript_2510:49-795(-)